MDGIYLLSLLTLISNIFLVSYVVILASAKLAKKKRFISSINTQLSVYSAKLALVVALVATFGSLYLSEVRKLTPCLLCWYQRIFMYPQVVLLASALLAKTRDVLKYTLVLSLIGVAIAAYHYNLQINPNPLTPCATVGISVSCSDRPFVRFGYITIPWMALSAFALISLLSYLGLNKRSKQG